MNNYLNLDITYLLSEINSKIKNKNKTYEFV